MEQQAQPNVQRLPTFHTARLILREITLADAPAYSRHFVDYEVIRNLSRAVPWPYPENGVAEFIRTVILPDQGNDRWAWAIAEKDNPEEAIGMVDLWRRGRPENRGFWLGRKFWGRGYMTEAVEPVMDYAFDHLGFERLVFTNAVGNTRSGRVKQKTGARLLYTEPATFVDPAFTEHEVYELTKQDWQAFKAARESHC
jgi:RimJ/RimL family protein N-acetyltransferase